MLDPRLPPVGARVTLRSFGRLIRGQVVYVTETPLVGSCVGEDTIAFTVKLRPSDYGHIGATPDEKINIFSIDSDFVEGFGWARGWDGPEVEALTVVGALT